MQFGAYLDQGSNGNVLSSLDFEKALGDVLHWLHREQDTLNQYLAQHPSVREPLVATFQGIIHPVPLPSPAVTPYPNDNPEQAPSPNIRKQTLQIEQLEDRGRDGLEEGVVLATRLQTDRVGEDNRLDDPSASQHQSPEREDISEIVQLQGTPVLTALTLNSGQACLGQTNDPAERLHQTVVEIGETWIDQVGHDIGQEVPSHRELDTPHTTRDKESVQNRKNTLPATSYPQPLPPTKRETLKRKRKSTSPAKPQPSKRKSKGSLDLDLLPAHLTQKVQNIVSFDDVVFLWERLQLLSAATASPSQEITHQDPGQPMLPLQTLPRRQRLELLWLCIGDNAKNERWATVVKRICQAEFFGQYLEERARFNLWKEERRLQRENHRTTLNRIEEDASPPLHPLAEYVDLCFPETIIRDGEELSQIAKDNREKAKKKFENMVQAKEPWVQFTRRFGKGVIIFTSAALKDEHLRPLGKHQLDALLDFIDASVPSLKDSLGGLSELFSFIIEHGRLPPYKLRLELLSKVQLEAMRSTDWSLKDLLEPCEQREGEYPANDSTIECDSSNDVDCIERDSLSTCSKRPRDLILCAKPTSPACSSRPLPNSRVVAQNNELSLTEGETNNISAQYTTPTEYDSETNFTSGTFYNNDAMFVPRALRASANIPSSLDNVYLTSPLVLLP